MTVQIRPAYQSDADAVAAFLHEHMSDRIPVQRWRNLFHFPWRSPDDTRDYGRIALAGGRVVGFLSRIYAERLIGGRLETVANISSWYLLKGFRKDDLGLRLYRELLEDRGDATYTVFSIARRTYPLYDRWGFALLDEHRWLWRRGSGDGTGIELLTEPAAIAQEIDPAQQHMLDEHRDFDLWPVLIRGAEGDCLAVITAKRKGDNVLFHDVLYLSDPRLFERYAPVVATRLLPEHNAVLAVDARFVSDRPDGAERVPIAVPRRYLSERLAPGSLDLMYSEVALLNLKLS